jgi:hypothetical protein
VMSQGWMVVAMAVVGVSQRPLNASNASSMATSLTPHFAVDEIHSPPIFIGDGCFEYHHSYEAILRICPLPQLAELEGDELMSNIQYR